MPRASAEAREAQKVSTPLQGGGYAASVGIVPSQSTWKDHAAALLSNLSGERKQRKKVLKGIIAALIDKREEFRREKKTGAGHATEAIEFYQYVIKVNETWKGKGGLKKGSNRRASKLKLKTKKGHRGPGRPRKYPRFDSDGEAPDSDTDSDSDSLLDIGDVKHSTFGSDADDDSSFSSMDEEEFLNQHNDLCEVCNTGGELLCCATCNLVFHMECVRPSLKVLPPDDWSCAHCDATGVTGHKKEARQRKRAAQAVREMERMWQNIKQRRAEEMEREKASSKESDRLSKDEKDKEIIANVVNQIEADDEEVAAAETEESESKKQELQLEASKPPPPLKSPPEVKKEDFYDGPHIDIGPGGTNKRQIDQVLDALSPLDFSQPRGRRQRKQPTLFDPQLGAASIWQSDGVSEWKYLAGQGGNTKNAPKMAGEATEIKEKDKIDETMKEKLDGKTEGAVNDKTLDKPKEKDSSKKESTSFSKAFPSVSKLPSQCKYCMDDETIKVCCFCACRICFSKRAKKHTLLCDMCDGEYHTFCLNPPLAFIPENEDWFCPTCCAKVGDGDETRAATATASASVELPSTPVPMARSVTDATSELVSPEKKSSPRPRTMKGTFAPIVDTPLVPAKRGPGRPRKHPLPTATPSPVDTKKVKISLKEKKTPVYDVSIKKANYEVTTKENMLSKTNNSINVTGDETTEGKQEISSSAADARMVSPKAKPLIIDHERRNSQKSVTAPYSTELAAMQIDPVSINSTTLKVLPETSGDTDTQMKAPPESPTTPTSPPFLKTFKSPSNQHASSTPLSETAKEPGREILTDGKKFESNTPSSKSVSSPPKFSNYGMLPSNTLQRSRSGRTVKRNTFHDEIEEGEQHLKSTMRNAVETGRISLSSDDDEEKITQEVVVTSPELKDTEVRHASETLKPEAAPTQQQLNVDGENLTQVTPTPMQTYFAEKSADSPTCIPLATMRPPDPTVALDSLSSVAIKPVAVQQNPVATPAHSTIASSPGMISSSSVPAQLSTTSVVASLTTPAPDAIIQVSLPTIAPASAFSNTTVTASIPTKTQENYLTPSVVSIAAAPTMANATQLLDKQYGSFKAVEPSPSPSAKVPRRKPGARECMQISRRFGVNKIPQKYIDILLDYCTRGKVEHLIRMRERLDDHSRFLESQLAGLETLVKQKGELTIEVPPAIPENVEDDSTPRSSNAY